MRVEYNNFGFYTIDVGYIKHLHDNIDEEVRFDAHRAYDRKPFLGIVVVIGSYTYFIPLTSSKPKHSKWKNVDKTYYLIYEIVKKSNLRKTDVRKPFSDTQDLKILAVLDIKKMIPVPEGHYSRIDFSKVADDKYRSLLMKEYRFCRKIREDILQKAKQIYEAQKNTGKVYPLYCNFSKLEEACDKYAMRTEHGNSVHIV